MSTRSYDVVVAGAGPAGIVTAIGFALRGASVLVCEANESAARRLAGEWLHPRGLAALESIGESLDDAMPSIPGRGFVIFSEDGDPIRLPYTGSRLARSFPHAALVGRLRERLRTDQRITYRAPARVVGIDRGRVRLADGAEVSAGMLVGADGRGSFVRRAVFAEDLSSDHGRMAGLLLEDAELPFEEHGHVLLGGPGAALLYRIDSRRSRLCLDVPDGIARTRAELWDAYAAVLPAGVRRSFREALENGVVEWASTRVSARRSYGEGRVALVGDAVGTVHPLCAAGITLALGDARALVEEGDLEAYAARRRRESRVAELLSEALERVLATRDPATDRLRESLLRTLRASPDERTRTMQLLSGERTDGRVFASAFLRVGIGALLELARERIVDRRAREELGKLLEYARYPLDAARHGARELPDERHLLATPIATPRTLDLDPPLAPRARTTFGEDGRPMSADHDFCEESLRLVSRSFARPISLLPPRLRLAVTVGYLLCRAADTIEDAEGIDRTERDALFALLLDVLEGRAPATRLARRSASLPCTKAEHELITQVHRVFGCLEALPAPYGDIVRRWASEMTRGMQIHASRPRGEDDLMAPLGMRDLERYCYFVAGTVGHMLTELFALELELDAARTARLREHAESFGVGLQLVNVLKDIHEDRTRGVSYVPRDLATLEGIALARLVDSASHDRAHAVVEPLFDLARSRLDEALEYALLLPCRPAGPRLFCLLPLFMAVRTLAHARGNDALFEGGVVVKIGRAEVEALVETCLLHHADDAALRRIYAELVDAPRTSACVVPQRRRA